MKIDVIDPTPRELYEYIKLEAFAREKISCLGIKIIRTCGEYVASECYIHGIVDGEEVASQTFRTVLDPKPSAAIASIMCDISCLILCLRDLGYDISYTNEEKIEPPKISRTILNGMLNVHHIKKYLQGTDLLEKIEKEEKRIKVEGARSGKAARLSKKQIIDLLFGEEHIEEVKNEARKPQRTGGDWSKAKELWSVEKFNESIFTKKYKTRDEFITFADDADVFGD
jgi:hypothetical protein